MDNPSREALDDVGMSPMPAWVRYLPVSVVMGVAIILSALVLFALSGHRVRAGLGVNPAECLSEDDDSARLLCYDRALRRIQQQPAAAPQHP